MHLNKQLEIVNTQKEEIKNIKKESELQINILNKKLIEAETKLKRVKVESSNIM
jgi:hypothetical protein